jgi:hypothetical protein
MGTASRLPLYRLRERVAPVRVGRGVRHTQASPHRTIKAAPRDGLFVCDNLSPQLPGSGSGAAPGSPSGVFLGAMRPTFGTPVPLDEVISVSGR